LNWEGGGRIVGCLKYNPVTWRDRLMSQSRAADAFGPRIEPGAFRIRITNISYSTATIDVIK